MPPTLRRLPSERTIESVIARRTAPVAVAVFLALTACDEPVRLVGPRLVVATAPADVPLVPRIIAPSVTDPAITYTPISNPARNHHFVWLDPAQHTNPRLFVILPGTGGRPFGMQFLQREAARLGYHVIGLMYQSDVVVSNACRGSADVDCSARMRMEILEGIDHSPHVNVDRAGSIDNRLVKLLYHLQREYPDEGWSGFMEDGAPKWSRIAVGGHSDGAGAAALIAKLRHVHRVVLLSGPSERRVADAVDTWLGSGQTPAVKHFALYHASENGTADMLANFAALGLGAFGVPVLQELGEAPYERTHILATDIVPTRGPTGPNPHNSTAVDPFVELGADGAPLLLGAWRYLLGDKDPPPRGQATPSTPAP